MLLEVLLKTKFYAASAGQLLKISNLGLLLLWLYCTEKQDTLLTVVWKFGAAQSRHQALNCSLACAQAGNVSIVRNPLL